MVRVSTYVFFDTETTGLPQFEKNRTKIIELSLLAVHREDMRRFTDIGILPPICKLSFILNPQKDIHSKKVTGLDDSVVKFAPTFKQKFNTIKSFLEDLISPVCLVAHNGDIFDYKILRAECEDAGVSLPVDLLCVDSLKGFRKLLITKPLNEDLLTDDENDEWPDLNITPEELKEIDDLCISLGNTKINSPTNKTPKKASGKKKRVSYKLSEIYRQLLNREPENAHRAEGDCIMLLQCVRACQNTENMSEDFLSWIDENCKKLSDIVPLQRK